MHNSTTKQELKPIWLRCIKELFEEAERNNQTEIEIRASELQNKAKIYNRFPSICNAMKSIIESNRDKKTSGVFNSSTYTIEYKLPRIKPIEIEVTTDINYLSNNSNKTQKITKQKLADNDLIKGENMKQDDIEEIVMNYYNKINQEHRFTSFDYCYNYFYTTSDLTKDMEKSCLHLGFYLASWGMLRNSSLLQKSSKYFQKVIEYISSLKNTDAWIIDVEKYNDENIQKQLLMIYSYIENILKGTVTLTTKVMLGVFGSIPAFDKYFKKTFNVSSFSGIIKIYNFYKENKLVIDNLSKKIFTTDFETGQKSKINYPKAKIIDMYGFNKGLMIEGRTEEG
jgi:hypothetical protein